MLLLNCKTFSTSSNLSTTSNFLLLQQIQKLYLIGSLFANDIIDFPMSHSTTADSSSLRYSHLVTSLSTPFHHLFFHFIPDPYYLVPCPFSTPITISATVESFVESCCTPWFATWFATYSKDCICAESHHSLLFQCIDTAYTTADRNVQVPYASFSNIHVEALYPKGSWSVNLNITILSLSSNLILCN